MTSYPDSGLVFLFQFVVSLIVCALVWIWFIGPYLRKRSVREQLTWVTIPLLFQIVGLTTLVDSVVNKLPIEFGWAVSGANVVTIPLVIALLQALRKGASGRLVLALAWLVTIVGFAGGFATVYVGYVKDVVDHLGPHWYVGILYLPLQTLSQLLILYTLLTRGRELRDSARPPDKPH